MKVNDATGVIPSYPRLIIPRTEKLDSLVTTITTEAFTVTISHAKESQELQKVEKI